MEFEIGKEKLEFNIKKDQAKNSKAKTKFLEAEYLRVKSVKNLAEREISVVGLKNHVSYDQQPAKDPRDQTDGDDEDQPVLDDIADVAGRFEEMNYLSKLVNTCIIRIMSDKGQGRTTFGVTYANQESPNSYANFAVAAYFNLAPDSYFNMNEIFFKQYKKDIADMRDGKVVIISNGDACAAKIVPKTEPAMNDSVSVVWNATTLAEASTAIGETRPGDCMVLVLDESRNARGLAVYSKQVSQYSPVSKHMKTLYLTHCVFVARAYAHNAAAHRHNARAHRHNARAHRHNAAAPPP